MESAREVYGLQFRTASSDGVFGWCLRKASSESAREVRGKCSGSARGARGPRLQKGSL